MYTPQKGRYVVAARDIEVGECLIHEEAIVNLVKSKHSLTHCYNCNKDTALTPLPCHRCAAVVFCSTECSEKSHSRYAFTCYSIIYSTIKDNNAKLYCL